MSEGFDETGDDPAIGVGGPDEEESVDVNVGVADRA